MGRGRGNESGAADERPEGQRPADGTPAPSARNHAGEPLLDAVDREILRCLREDGRMGNSEIARRLAIGEATVRRRLQRMTDTHALRVVPVVDPDTVGLRLSVLIGLKVHLARIEQIADTIAKLPEVRYVALATGPYDLLVEAFMGSREHLAEFLFGPLADVEGVVSSETATILKVVKFAYEWEIPRLPLDGGVPPPPER